MVTMLTTVQGRVCESPVPDRVCESPDPNMIVQFMEDGGYRILGPHLPDRPCLRFPERDADGQWRTVGRKPA